MSTHSNGNSSRGKAIARLSRRAWKRTSSLWQLRSMKGLMGAALAIGIGAGAGKIAHTQYTRNNTSRAEATFEAAAQRSGKASRDSVKDLPWSVLHDARIEAKRRNIGAGDKKFDALIDEAFTQRKKRDAGDRDPTRGGFASNPTIELIDALMNLPQREIESRLKQLYARDTPESRQLYQHNLDRALKAKPELTAYFNERAARATEAARKANSENERKAYEQIARAAKKHALKVGAISGGAAALMYVLLLQAVARRRKRK